MSELRRDTLAGIDVVIAPGRSGIGALRPGGLPAVARERCPFCPGHEAETEDTLHAEGDPWQVRVVRNRFPMMRAAPDAPSAQGAIEARGEHEVVIEARDHDADLATYGAAHAALVLRAIRARVRALEALPGAAAVIAFRNRGRRAGSSQPHPHAQIVALPYVPPEVARRAEIAARGPVLADAIARERADGARVLFESEGAIALCPFASHRAWEARVALVEEHVRFSEVDDARLDALAAALARVAAAMRAALDVPDYNVLLRDPPVAVDRRRASFTLDVLPRTGGDAGFELASGTPVCVVRPEDAAQTLRRALAR